MTIRLRIAAVVAAASGLAACGGKPPPTPVPEAPKADAAAPAAIVIPRNPAPAGAKVTIISPASGAVVKSPVTVKFGIEGMTLAPAGTNDPNAGHHHLLVDADIPALDRPIPKDPNHVHYGQGQTEGQVELTPGQHTLQLLLGDGNHVAQDPPVSSEQITITAQ